MWSSKVAITLCLLASLIVSEISATPRNEKIESENIDFDVDCGKNRIYTRIDLMKAGTSACTKRFNDELLREHMRCRYYLGNCLPFHRSVTDYTGQNFADTEEGYQLLTSPFPKRFIIERVCWRAVVAYDSRTKYCKTLGAEVMMRGKEVYTKCEEINNGGPMYEEPVHKAAARMKLLSGDQSLGYH